MIQTEACQLHMAPTNPLLRKWQGLPEVPFLGNIPAHILEDPILDHV